LANITASQSRIAAAGVSLVFAVLLLSLLFGLQVVRGVGTY
jgi:hypothetical protein